MYKQCTESNEFFLSNAEQRVVGLIPAQSLVTLTYSNLILCISTDIRNLAMKADIEHTGELLNQLKTQYGTMSISAAYTDAATVDKLQVLGDCNPTSTIDKLLALFTQLEDNKFIYPELIRAMMLLVRLSPQIEEIA